MFDKDLIETDNFMDLPLGTKGFYFVLGMEADDEGFVSPRRVMRIYGGSDDDLKLLLAKGFAIIFQSGVVVITDWRKNNWLDKRRVKPTEYQQERKELGLVSVSNQRYILLSSGLATASLEEYRGEENRGEESSEKDTTASFEAPAKNGKIEKKKYGEFENVRLTEEEHQKLTDKIGRSRAESLIEELSTYVASKGKKYSSHYATILSWARKPERQAFGSPKISPNLAFRNDGESTASKFRRISEKKGNGTQV